MFYESPAGCITIEISDNFISGINFVKKDEEHITSSSPITLSAEGKRALKKCTAQLDEYFSGKRKKFDLPIQQDGTEFQQKVWSELLLIPYGKTISYLQLSQRLGNVKAIRAVGAANGRNHLSIVVPCHRVIGSDGSLTGYGGGLDKKRWLLDHEAKFENGVQVLF